MKRLTNISLKKQYHLQTCTHLNTLAFFGGFNSHNLIQLLFLTLFNALLWLTLLMFSSLLLHILFLLTHWTLLHKQNLHKKHSMGRSYQHEAFGPAAPKSLISKTFSVSETNSRCSSPASWSPLVARRHLAGHAPGGCLVAGVPASHQPYVCTVAPQGVVAVAHGQQACFCTFSAAAHGEPTGSPCRSATASPDVVRGFLPCGGPEEVERYCLPGLTTPSCV
jgi:hypothetical protein